MSFVSHTEKPPQKPPRVLVADDASNIRRAMWLILKSEFDVTLAENGLQAVTQFREGNDFDVVSLDIQMPEMSGIEALKAIKESNPNVEVLIVTAHSDIESAKEALKYGAYDYLDKPFEKESLRAAIRRGVERRRRAVASERARESLEFVKAQLMESEKFAALGQLIAGVSHELNNPLAAIMGYTDLLLMSEQSPEQTRKSLQNIKQAADLCRNIIQKLLTFSRKREKKREPVQVNEIIESTLDLKRHDFKVSGIKLEKELAEDLPPTMADYQELQQVFLNITNNAQQAMNTPDGRRTLTVKTAFDGSFIRVTFEDTGPGISRENLQKIFEPLFTTKKPGEGTGLGLSVCYEIIQAHDGNIFVASEEGKGACFAVEIPITRAIPLVAPMNQPGLDRAACPNLTGK